MTTMMLNYIEWLYNNLNKTDIYKKNHIAIYGTGEALPLIYNYFVENRLVDKLACIIDRDDSENIGSILCGMKITTFDAICAQIDAIVIAAKYNHMIIQERVERLVEDKSLSISIINPFMHVNLDNDYIEYVRYLENNTNGDKSLFVEFTENNITYSRDDTKVIAWYLPQFHQIEMNNKYHGQGFTEWTNSSKAIPQFTGHYQPHIPYDVGYYDLLNLNTFKRQIFLAKNYGIYGFAFHYYWFSGERIMEKPLELFLEHKELDMPFCINWANENWTSAWDGGNQHVMLEQRLNPKDDESFARDVLRLFHDDRYIKVNGKPLLSIYRSDLYEKSRFIDFINKLRMFVKREGFPDIFILITTATKNDDDVVDWGADGLVEFPPRRLTDIAVAKQPGGYINPDFRGQLWSMKSFVEKKKFFAKYLSKKVFRTAMVSFDNTARRGRQGCHVFYDLTPKLYGEWLKNIITESEHTHTGEEKMVFVNAWNEWAEGAHLEPDLKFGYAYLKATAIAILNARKERKNE